MREAATGSVGSFFGILLGNPVTVMDEGISAVLGSSTPNTSIDALKSRLDKSCVDIGFLDLRNSELLCELLEVAGADGAKLFLPPLAAFIFFLFSSNLSNRSSSNC